MPSVEVSLNGACTALIGLACAATNKEMLTDDSDFLTFSFAFAIAAPSVAVLGWPSDAAFPDMKPL